MLNQQSTADYSQVISGKDGQLFVSNRQGTNIFLGEVDTFAVQINVNNTDFQPVGSALSYAVNLGYSVTLTLTETVIRDDVMISEFVEDLSDGFFPAFDFQGKLRRRDGQEERVVLRNCVPDSSVDLLKVSPGELIKRSWSFRVNSVPQLLDMFAS